MHYLLVNSTATVTSSLHRSSSQPLHYPPLKQKNHSRNGRRRDDSCSQNLSPRYLVLATKQRDGDRHRLAVRAEREREREQELVPAVDESENPRRRQTRHREREQDSGETLSSSSAVDVRGLLEILRNLSDRSGEHPHREWHRERHVRHDQPGIGVDQSQRAQKQIERADDRDLGEHRHGQNER